MSEVLVSMKDIEKTFPGVHALSQCKFELNAGEVHGLIGENGAGKSTLMKILTGVYSKDSGHIYYKGEEVDITTPKMAQNMGISIIHQELNLMPHLTVAQNIFIGREPRIKNINFLLNEKEINEKARQELEKLNLKIDPKTKASNLTVAKQQMVEITKALSYNSEVLIMDEPTAALTESEIEELFRIIHNLRNKGVGIVYISHRMDELKKICDRVTVMRDGCYVDTVLMKDVTIDQIISMMVGRTIYESKPEINKNDSAEVVLEVKNPNRGKVLKNINFNLKKGEILGFAGLMEQAAPKRHVPFGADKTDSCEIFINGQQINIKSPEDAVKNGIGYLSEDRKRYGIAIGLDIETNVVMAILKVLSF